jgi:hypothetical protein
MWLYAILVRAAAASAQRGLRFEKRMAAVDWRWDV